MLPAAGSNNPAAEKNIRMKGLIVYRVLSFFVNLFCALIAVSLLMAIFVVFANPGAALNVFIMIGVVLYGWYANKFFVRVILQKDTITRRQKDWLQVNAIVALIFALNAIAGFTILVLHPQRLDEILKSLPVPAGSTSSKLLMNVITLMLFFCIMLLIHIVWTYILVRRNKDAIAEDDK